MHVFKDSMWRVLCKFFEKLNRVAFFSTPVVERLYFGRLDKFHRKESNKHVYAIHIYWLARNISAAKIIYSSCTPPVTCILAVVIHMWMVNIQDRNVFNNLKTCHLCDGRRHTCRASLDVSLAERTLQQDIPIKYEKYGNDWDTSQTISIPFSNLTTHISYQFYICSKI